MLSDTRTLYLVRGVVDPTEVNSSKGQEYCKKLRNNYCDGINVSAIRMAMREGLVNGRMDHTISTLIHTYTHALDAQEPIAVREGTHSIYKSKANQEKKHTQHCRAYLVSFSRSRPNTGNMQQ